MKKKQNKNKKNQIKRKLKRKMGRKNLNKYCLTDTRTGVSQFYQKAVNINIIIFKLNWKWKYRFDWIDSKQLNRNYF